MNITQHGVTVTVVTPTFGAIAVALHELKTRVEAKTTKTSAA